MRAVEHYYRCARRLIVALMHVQIAIFQIDRHLQSLALNRRQQGRVHIEVDRVAKLVGLARAFGFDTGGQMRGVVPAERALAQTAKQAPQSLVTEKVETLLSHLEFHVARQRLTNAAWSTMQLVASLIRIRLLFTQGEIAFF